MCGTFDCSKKCLIGLNIIYILVALILIGVGAAAKAASVVQSLPVVGGIIACGVFLLFIAIVGLYGALKHHQVTLFVYMVVLFSIFVLQFSVACASLAASVDDEMNILAKTFVPHSNGTATTAFQDLEKNLNCCNWPSKFNDTACPAENPAGSCEDLLHANINYAFNSAGGVGLFFAFTELVALAFAHRFRTHLKNQIA